MRQNDSDPPITSTSDRGPARYFHGRTEILQDYNKFLLNSIRAKDGTILVIQGPPGAGKTALLHQCERIAKNQDWKTVEIDPPALWDPYVLRDSLPYRNIFRLISGTFRIGAGNGVSAEVNVNKSLLTIHKILQSGKRPLLLILDEAQMLGETNKPTGDQAKIASNVLKAIHNGKLGRPVILIAAGLGTTLDAFKSLGISRFAMRSCHELGALSKESERAVIHDWLIQEGGAKGDTTRWINAIAEHSHGWPQHILSYADPAAKYLQSNRHIMTEEGLVEILNVGHQFRLNYYEARVNGFTRQQRQIIASLITNPQQGEYLDKENVIYTLASKYGDKGSKKFFNEIVDTGILHMRSGGMYAVPIPSMRDWLVDNYAQ